MMLTVEFEKATIIFKEDIDEIRGKRYDLRKFGTIKKIHGFYDDIELFLASQLAISSLPFPQSESRL
jgi:hypothetical protein